MTFLLKAIDLGPFLIAFPRLEFGFQFFIYRGLTSLEMQEKGAPCL